MSDWVSIKLGGVFDLGYLQLRMDKIIDVCKRSGAQVRNSYLTIASTQPDALDTINSGCSPRLWIPE